MARARCLLGQSEARATAGLEPALLLLHIMLLLLMQLLLLLQTRVKTAAAVERGMVGERLLQLLLMRMQLAR